MSGFYDASGVLISEVQKANGDGYRKATVADARKLGLVPRFSSIVQYKNSYFLNQWIVDNALKCAIENTGKSLDEIKSLLEVERDLVMNAGTSIHNRIENALKGADFADETTRKAVELLRELFVEIRPEEAVVTPYAGGRTDILGKNQNGEYSVIDIKTVTKYSNDRKISDSHALQIAGYTWAWAFNGYTMTNPGILYIAQDSDEMHLVQLNDKDWRAATIEFLSVLIAWRACNGFESDEKLIDELKRWAIKEK